MKSILRPVSVLLVLALLAAAGCRKKATPALEPSAPAPAQTQPAATLPTEAKVGEHMTLSVPTLEGKRFTLEAERGSWVVVNMWATWCGPCIEEMPELSALDAMHEDIRVIGLDMEDLPRAELDAFLAKHPVVYPIAAVDPSQPPAGFGSVQYLPKTWLINPNGVLVQVFPGPVTAQRLLDAIARAKTAPAAAR